MFRFGEDYLERLGELHDDISQPIQGLSIEALDWKPAAEANSIAVLLTHLVGAERYWVGDVVAQDPSDRIRATEFTVSHRDETTLRVMLPRNREYIRDVLGRLSHDDLNALRTSPNSGRICTVAWALLHALEHTAQHSGHIQITRQLWDQLAGQKPGLS